MSRHLTRDPAAIACAVLAPLAAALVVLPFRASWPNTNVALPLVVVLVAVAALGNCVAGALAAVGAAVWSVFFFTVPYERFTIRSTADVTTFVLLLVVGVAVSQLAAYARRLKVIALTDPGYLTQLQEATALAQSARSPQVVAEHVRGQLVGLLGLEGSRFEFGSLRSHPPRLEADGTVVAGHGSWDVEQAGLPEEVELRVCSSGQYYGRFLLRPRPGSRPSLQARCRHVLSPSAWLIRSAGLQRRCGGPERTLTTRPDRAALPQPRIVRLALAARDAIIELWRPGRMRRGNLPGCLSRSQ